MKTINKMVLYGAVSATILTTIFTILFSIIFSELFISDMIIGSIWIFIFCGFWIFSIWNHVPTHNLKKQIPTTKFSRKLTNTTKVMLSLFVPLIMMNIYIISISSVKRITNINAAHWNFEYIPIMQTTDFYILLFGIFFMFGAVILFCQTEDTKKPVYR